MYSSYYTLDRSGAQLFDILLAYFTCYQKNINYIGAIPLKTIKKQNIYSYNNNINETKKLIEFLNLPNNRNYDDKYQIKNYKGNKNFSDEFRNILFENCKKNLWDIKKDKEISVTIHIRRGDVTKDGRWNFRYINDDYYLELMEEIYRYSKNTIFYIFSDNDIKNSENGYKYKKFNSIFMTSTKNNKRTLVEAFNYFIKSNIFIMGCSSFSHVPALFRRHGLTIFVSSKYMHALPDWIDGTIENKKNEIKKFLTN